MTADDPLMSFAENVSRPPWDDAHTVLVPMAFVRFCGTTATPVRLGSAPGLRVCRACRCSETLCRCAWREASPAYLEFR